MYQWRGRYTSDTVNSFRDGFDQYVEMHHVLVLVQVLNCYANHLPLVTARILDFV